MDYTAGTIITNDDGSYYANVIATLDCDSNPASIEVTASPGEFEGVTVEIRAEGVYALTELRGEALDQLIVALTEARAYHNA